MRLLSLSLKEWHLVLLIKFWNSCQKKGYYYTPQRDNNPKLQSCLGCLNPVNHPGFLKGFFFKKKAKLSTFIYSVFFFFPYLDLLFSCRKIWLASSHDIKGSVNLPVFPQENIELALDDTEPSTSLSVSVVDQASSQTLVCLLTQFSWYFCAETFFNHIFLSHRRAPRERQTFQALFSHQCLMAQQWISVFSTFFSFSFLKIRGVWERLEELVEAEIERLENWLQQKKKKKKNRCGAFAACDPLHGNRNGTVYRVTDHFVITTEKFWVL